MSLVQWSYKIFDAPTGGKINAIATANKNKPQRIITSRRIENLKNLIVAAALYFTGAE
jgi:hypothetical protein